MSGKSRAGAIVTALLALAIVGIAGGWFYLRYALQGEVYRAVEKLEKDSKGNLAVKIGGVDVDPIRRQATLRDVTITAKEGSGEPMVVEVASVHVKKWVKLQSGSEVLREQAIDWRGVRSPQIDRYVAQAPPAVKQLIGDSLVFDVSHSSTFRPDRQNEFEMDAVVSTPKLGELSTHFLGSGVDLAKLEQLKRDAGTERTSEPSTPALQGKALTALAQTQIHNVRLMLRDQGLMAVILAATASERGTTVEEARGRMLTDLQAACDRPQAATWAKPLCVPLAAFIQQPKSLRVTAEPPTPLPAGSLGATAMSGGLQALVSALNLKLAANQD